MTRSSSGSFRRREVGEGAGAPPALPWTLEAGLRTANLTSVAPRDQDPEDDVETAEPRREKRGPPGRRAEERDPSEHHESHPHHRDDPDGEGAAGHDCGAVEEEPESRQDRHAPGPRERQGRQGPGRERGRKGQEEAPRGTGEEGNARAPRLGGDRPD